MINGSNFLVTGWAGATYCLCCYRSSWLVRSSGEVFLLVLKSTENQSGPSLWNTTSIFSEICLALTRNDWDLSSVNVVLLFWSCFSSPLFLSLLNWMYQFMLFLLIVVYILIVNYIEFYKIGKWCANILNKSILKTQGTRILFLLPHN